MRTSRIRIGALSYGFVFTVIASATSARAQNSQEETDSHAEYRRGVEAMTHKDWAEAERIFFRLWRRAQTYDVAASLGQVEYHLQKYTAGARFLQFAVENIPPTEKAETLSRFQLAFKELRDQVATIHLTLSSSRAEVQVDGQPLSELGASPDLYLDPGTHTIAARVRGGAREIKTLNVVAGGVYAVELNPEAPVVAAVVPSEPAPAAAATTSKPDPVSPAPAFAVSQVSSAPRGRSAIPMYVGLAITGLGAASAIGFGVAAENARNELIELDNQRRGSNPDARSACSLVPSSAECSKINRTYDRQREDAVFARIGLAVGAVAGLATLGYWIFWPEHSQRETAEGASQLVPSIAILPGQATAWLSGRF